MASSYDILRNFLNEAIKGVDTDAVLYALSTGDDLLAQNSQAAVQNMFLATASGEYLDFLSSNVGVVRPNNIGISDDSLRNISKVFIGYKNTTNSLNDLLKIYFSVYQTNAYVQTTNGETFSLSNGDNLTIKLDGSTEYDIYFDSAYFNNIATASAEEVANYLNSYFLKLQIGAVATVYHDIQNNLIAVRLITKTTGAKGAIAIIGGTAQKALNFSDLAPTTQTNTTQFTITQPRNGVLRFTWTGGTDPSFELIDPDGYVIISGANFQSVNKGSYDLVGLADGPVNFGYFEIYNTSGTNQTLTLSAANDLLFYNNVNYKITSRDQYAAIFETTPGVIDLTIPASTSIIERTPSTGGSYLMEKQYSLSLTYTVSVTFSVGETVIDTSTFASGIILSVTNGGMVLGDVQEVIGSFGTSGHILGETSSVSLSYVSVTKSYINSLTGTYLYDLDSYILTATSTSLSDTIHIGDNNIVLNVASTANFDDSGYLVLDFGFDNEETLVPYIAVLNSTQIQINPSYIFTKYHAFGSNITLLLSKDKYTVSNNGDDLGVYLTDVANARQNFVDNFYKIKSSGIVVNEDILYPNDYGLPNAGTAYSDIIRVYGPDSALDTDGFLKLV